ncbi:MAG: hypothetical protein HQM12_06960 [SAR324 cluster bacterium]|nr:hypothetical protein [SAR324 cluster bacterium]
MTHIAVFISPHGFGHAARVSAIMTALAEIEPQLEFDIFTLVPEWFFRDFAAFQFNYFPLNTDIGFIQSSAFVEDIPQTLNAIDALIPFRQEQVTDLANLILSRDCRLVLCDIAPLGIQVAETANIPSVLIENFTWDWIYQGYLQEAPELKKSIDYLSGIFSRATHHIQTEPAHSQWKYSLRTNPVSNKPRTAPEQIRNQLGILPDKKWVLISMGGILQNIPHVERLTELENIQVVMLCALEEQKRDRNLILYPHHTSIYHPDLVHAADAVIGKVGYSTVAEVYHAGVPFGCVLRPRFPENEILRQFLAQNTPVEFFSPETFESGQWIDRIPALVQRPKVPRSNIINGSRQAAEYLYRVLLDRTA